MTSDAAEQHDRELVRAMAAGESTALRELHQRHVDRVRRFLFRLGCRDHEVDAVINEAFFTAWQSAARFRGDSRVITWLLGIARNHGLKAVTRERLRSDRLTQGEEPDLLAANELPAARRLELRQWLEVGLAALPPEQRQVLELLFVDGLSCREIAQVMDCPENTVKTRLFHARRKLREILPDASTASPRSTT